MDIIIILLLLIICYIIGMVGSKIIMNQQDKYDMDTPMSKKLSFLAFIMFISFTTFMIILIIHIFI